MEEDITESAGVGRPAAPTNCRTGHAAIYMSNPGLQPVDRRVASPNPPGVSSCISTGPNLTVTTGFSGRSRRQIRRLRSREPRPHRHIRHSNKRAPQVTIHDLFAGSYKTPQSYDVPADRWIDDSASDTYQTAVRFQRQHGMMTAREQDRRIIMIRSYLDKHDGADPDVIRM